MLADAIWRAEFDRERRAEWRHQAAFTELLTQVEHYNWAVIVATAVVIAIVGTGTVIAFRRYDRRMALTAECLSSSVRSGQ